MRLIWAVIIVLFLAAPAIAEESKVTNSAILASGESFVVELKSLYFKKSGDDKEDLVEIEGITWSINIKKVPIDFLLKFCEAYAEFLNNKWSTESFNIFSSIHDTLTVQIMNKEMNCFGKHIIQDIKDLYLEFQKLCPEKQRKPGRKETKI